MDKDKRKFKAGDVFQLKHDGNIKHFYRYIRIVRISSIDMCYDILQGDRMCDIAFHAGMMTETNLCRIYLLRVDVNEIWQRVLNEQ